MNYKFEKMIYFDQSITRKYYKRSKKCELSDEMERLFFHKVVGL